MFISDNSNSNSTNNNSKALDYSNNNDNIKRQNNVNINTNFTISNSSSKKKIPRPGNNNNRNKKYIVNSKTSENILNFPDNQNSNFLNDDNTKINILRKSYDNRLGTLLLNFQKTINNITNQNAKELINEVIFMEKEKIIADLYEQNAIIRNEYEENKLEMIRLQKVISVLEIDLHKCQKKLTEKINEITELNDSLSKQQAENFDLNLRIKELIENDQHNNVSKDLNFSSTNFGGVAENDKTVIQLTEELNKFVSDNKQSCTKRNEKETNEIFTNLKNKHKNEIDSLVEQNEKKILLLREQMEEQIKEITNKNDQKIKKYQTDLDFYISENNKINNKLKLDEQIIILMRSKISSIKSEVKTLQKFVLDKFSSFSKDNAAIFKIITDKINYNFNNINVDFSFERKNDIKNKYEKEFYGQLKLSEKYQKENKNLLATQEENIKTIKSLNNKCDLYEKENHNLIGQINKLNFEIEILNESFNNIKNKSNSNILSKDYMKFIKIKITNMKLKYIQEISTMKQKLNYLINNVNLLNAQNNNNDEKNNEKNTQKTQLIEEMQKKINIMKCNQKEYIKAINKKNKKIRDLQDALNKSLVSFSSGMKNIKIANLLDNEVKEFLKQNKDTSSDINIDK